MKLAKKVLSVVLALVLALSAFAVVGSANGDPETATHHAKIWLTGSVGSAVWSSNSKVTITEGDESEAGGTLEVQPGDYVFVRLYLTNDYYVHTFQANLFYSSALIDAFEDYHAQRPSLTSKMTAANQKKIHIWNSDHPWVAENGTSYAAYNAWSYQAEAFNADIEQNWPTDDEGNNLFNTSEWKFNRLNNLVSEGIGWTCIWDDPDNHLIMMAVKVPTTAEPGDTFYVTVPEGTEQREAKPKGALRLYENGIADGEEEVGETVDTQSSLNPNMKYGDEYLYWDLSEATLTLQVPGEAGVDTAELEAKIAEAAELLTTDITADSKAALNEAINGGNAALSSNDQTVIDDAVAALNAAIAAAEGLADYTELNKAIARYNELNSADWSNFAEATAAYDVAAAIEEGLGVSAQDTIDAAADALNAAIDNLKAALNYADLEAKYNELAGKDVANYTDDTVARFNTALAAAKSLIDNKNAADQDEINAAYDELVAADAALALKAANYAALDEAIAKYEALNANDWTADSYAAATEKYEAAKGIAAGLDITAQPAIDEAAAALEAAITALVPAEGANYADLDAAIAEAEALVADHYVSFADVATALANAKAVARDLTANEQAIIDAAKDALVAAMGALVEADADYTAVNNAIVAADAILAKMDAGVNSYSDATLDAINAAKADVVTGLKKKDQDQVDAMATAINAAVANAEFRAWDYTAINDHIAAIEANDAKYYDADDYADYLAAKEALVWNYTYENYAKAKLQEINFLKVNPAAAAAADYSAVNDAITAFNDKIAAADYEQAGIDAVNAIIDAIDWNLNANDQEIVDQYAADIIAATAALVEVVVEPADYTELDKAIEAAKALVADEYVNFADVEDALADAEAVARDLTIDDQATVDAAAAALNKAIEALEAKANYDALDAAILRAGTYDQNVWTTDSWAVVEEKLAAAVAVDRNLGVSAQGTIDAAAEALNTALDNLKAKEVVSSISTINWTPSEDTHNTFSVAVNGRMAMIQFIEEDGGTRTYDRYNKNVTIVSYNAEGEVVNSLDRSVAYEVWTINTNLVGPNVKARAKYLTGASYVWETETYNFTVETIEPTFDAEIREITPAATSGKKGAVATTVVVGPDAQGVRFVMANGSTTTYYAEKATVLDNGDLQFVGNAWANDAGLNTIIVKVRVNGAWVEAGTVEYTVE